MQESFLMKSLKPILDSKDGIHLSAYIPKPKNVSDARKFALEISLLAHRFLEPVFSKAEFDDFVASIDQLLRDPKFVHGIKGSIGIFKNKHFLRVVSVPFEVELNCFVANSFHVKPLLKWIQMDQQFFLVGFGHDCAFVYSGTQQTLRLLKIIPFTDQFKRFRELKTRNESKINRILKNPVLNEVRSIFRACIEILASQDGSVFLAGNFELSKKFRQVADSLEIHPENLRLDFSDKMAGRIVDQIRAIKRLESKLDLDRNLIEFQNAVEENKTKQNLFAIAKAAVRGQIEKLVVSEEIEIFGKLDRKSGTLKLHAVDMDHEDDDVLDDIAQTVLSFGGEVLIAKQSDIPNRRPILAIFNPSTPDSLQKSGESISKSESRII